MLKKNILIVSLGALLLTSCGADNKEVVPAVTTPSATHDAVAPEVSVTPITATGTVSKTASGAKGTPAEMIISADGPTVDRPASTEYMKNPKFPEFQKNQELLVKKLSEIKTDEYIKLNTEYMNILEGKEIWNPELKRANEKFQEVLANIGKAGTGSEIAFKEALSNHEAAMKTFRMSREFQEYLNKNTEKLESIKAKKEKLLPPEVVKLQKEVSDLKSEIFKVQ